jgi:molybdopterin synthase catalytic subunit
MSSEFVLTTDPIVTSVLVYEIADRRTGAVVSFEGRVRDHNLGREVVALEYEVYPELAQSEGERIHMEAVHQFGILAVRTVHRFGKLGLADVAVSVVVAAHHRDAAFAACRYIIDELKVRVPIWKKEYYAEHSAGWVGCPGCQGKHGARTDAVS